MTTIPSVHKIPFEGQVMSVIGPVNPVLLDVADAYNHKEPTASGKNGVEPPIDSETIG
jgi:hypothetical protein